MNFEEIYKNYYRELYAFALLLRITTVEAEDLVQETFTRFYKEIRKQTEFDNPRAWLYKVLLNLFATQNKLKVLHHQYLDNHKEESQNNSEYPSDFAAERQQIVFSFIERMDDKDRLLLSLYNKGFSYNEIADVMDMNPTSVGKTLTRAIEKLRKKLKQNYHEMFE